MTEETTAKAGADAIGSCVETPSATPASDSIKHRVAFDLDITFDNIGNAQGTTSGSTSPATPSTIRRWPTGGSTICVC